MPATTAIHGFRIPGGGDKVAIPQDMANLAADIDAQTPVVSTTTPAKLVSGLLWFNPTTGLMQVSDGVGWAQVFVPKSSDFRTRTSVAPLIDARAGGVKVTSYDGPSYAVGVDIGFASGIWTIKRAGLYRWTANVSFSVEAGSVLVQLQLNGTTQSVNGALEMTLSSTHATKVVAGGAFVGNLGDTLQLALGYLDGSDNNVNVNGVLVERIG